MRLIHAIPVEQEPHDVGVDRLQAVHGVGHGSFIRQCYFQIVQARGIIPLLQFPPGRDQFPDRPPQTPHGMESGKRKLADDRTPIEGQVDQERPFCLSCL